MGRKRRKASFSLKQYFSRMVPFLLKYWRLIVLMFLLSLVHSCASYGRVALIKPIMEKVFVIEVKGDPASEANKKEKHSEPNYLEYAPPFLRDKRWVRILFAMADKDAEVPGVAVKDFFYMICVLAILVAFVLGVALYCKVIVQRLLVNSVTVDLRRYCYAKLVRQDVDFFDRRRSGDLLARVTVDLDLARRSLDHLSIALLDKPLYIVGGLVFCFATSWKLSLIFFVGMPVILFPILVLGKRIRKGASRRQEHMGSISDALVQTFSGIRIIKAFRLEEIESDSFAEKNRQFFRQDMSVARARGLSRASTEFLYTAGSAAALMIFGGIFLSGASMDAVGGPGAIGMFFFALSLMYTPSKQLVKAYNHFEESAAGAERLFEVVDQAPGMKDGPDAVVLSGVERGIKFNDVHFHYNENDKVLKGVDLEIPVGKTVAVVGPSGAGKSTLLDLIPRFYEVVGGSVTIDGRDVRDLTLDSLYDNVSVVQQDPFLFNTTIRENIRMGRPGAVDAEIDTVAEAAQVMEFVRQLPNGLDTECGERGNLLSGGQRQRVTIARAMLKDAPILLLDEAMSSLDTRSERLVQGALEGLMRGRTTLAIAHRLSTIRHSDQIIVMREGRIIEQGTHDALLAAGGVYAQLYGLQHGGDE